jgi:hypothetical protein
MDLLTPVPNNVWQDRLNWLEALEQKNHHPLASYVVSEHGILLTYDVHKSFCSGAWVSVIVLCHAAIDATIRDTETGDYASNSKKLFGGDKDLEWLRKKRNQLVHVSSGPIGDVGNFDSFHDSLETDARRAVELLFRTIYASPGT